MADSRQKLRSVLEQGVVWALLLGGIVWFFWGTPSWAVETEDEIEATVKLASGLNGLLQAVHSVVEDFTRSGSPMHTEIMTFVIAPLVVMRFLFETMKLAADGRFGDYLSACAMLVLWALGFEYYSVVVIGVLDAGPELAEAAQRQLIGGTNIDAPFKIVWSIIQSYNMNTPTGMMNAVANPAAAFSSAISSGILMVTVIVFMAVMTIVMYLPVIGGGVVAMLGLFVYPFIFVKWGEGIVSAWVKALIGVAIFHLIARLTVCVTVLTLAEMTGVTIPADGSEPVVGMKEVNMGNLGNICGIFIFGSVAMLGAVPLANRVGGGAEVGMNALVGLAMSGRSAGQMGKQVMGLGGGGGANKVPTQALASSAKAAATGGGSVAGDLAMNAAKATAGRAVGNNNG